MSGRTIFVAKRPRGAGIHRRTGYTLVELIVVISINAVLMAVGASVLGTLLRTEHQGRCHFDRASGLVRLADQWRSDVAASETGAVVPAAAALAGAKSQPAAPQTSALRLQSAPDHKIEFFRDGDRLRRIEYQGPAVVRREAYLLSDLVDADFSVSESQIATLRLTFGKDKSGARDTWQIDARLARDRRFAETGDSRQPTNL
ncbi:MAG TPA: prepilin-type N-terminal cleavage/methylation domain-containing protein [Pirellulales bacterium]|nr:prepilin-type N-terminal cleavage/methylation domain-containing protein [Pirellulales bacterium]